MVSRDNVFVFAEKAVSTRSLIVSELGSVPLLKLARVGIAALSVI